MAEFTAKQVGERIKERRQDFRLSMEGLAKVLGMNKSTIQRYETKGVDPKKKYLLVSIANALDTTVEWLTGETNEKNPDITTKCRAEIDEHISAYMNTLTENVDDEAHQQLLTNLLGGFIDMFGVICIHHGATSRRIDQMEKDFDLKDSLVKYALETSDLYENLYSHYLEESVEDFKSMADCVLNMYDRRKSHVKKFYDILEKAKERKPESYVSIHN
ncbi:MAG: helix-turn-helix transcriptional regulator [Oscillospiraceae bacterium]|nr:helix-turn-helix transcriptional regulator [Oscillospiraceae bacterium]